MMEKKPHVIPAGRWETGVASGIDTQYNSGYSDGKKAGKEQSKSEIVTLTAQMQLMRVAVSQLMTASDSVCCSLDHPTESVNALQMWNLRDAINLVKDTKLFEVT